MNENKVKVWLARDKNGELYIYNVKPGKLDNSWWGGFGNGNRCVVDYFPSVKWEDDEPTEAYITLAEPQEKKEIDWEQRRYEIAKTLFSKLSIYTSKNEIKHIIERILEFTDLFINELKKQSE